jgi:hypothetical protein
VRLRSGAGSDTGSLHEDRRVASTTTPRAPPRGALGARARRPRPRGSVAWRDVSRRGFDAPERFAAYLHAQRWSCVTATNPRLFQAPLPRGHRVEAYQLEPLRKALQMPAREPLHRRRRRARQDHRGRPHPPRADHAPEGAPRRRRRAPLRRDPVARRAGAALRPRPSSSRPRLRRPKPPRAGVRRQPLVHPHAASSSPTRCSATRPTPRPSATGSTDPPGALLILDEAHNAAPASGFEVRHRLEASPAPCATSRRASSTASSSPPRPTTGTPTPSPPCSRSSTPALLPRRPHQVGEAQLDAVMVRRLKQRPARHRWGSSPSGGWCRSTSTASPTTPPSSSSPGCSTSTARPRRPPRRRPTRSAQAAACSCSPPCRSASSPRSRPSPHPRRPPPRRLAPARPRRPRTRL